MDISFFALAIMNVLGVFTVFREGKEYTLNLQALEALKAIAQPALPELSEVSTACLIKKEELIPCKIVQPVCIEKVETLFREKKIENECLLTPPGCLDTKLEEDLSEEDLLTEYLSSPQGEEDWEIM